VEVAFTDVAEAPEDEVDLTLPVVVACLLVALAGIPIALSTWLLTLLTALLTALTALSKLPTRSRRYRAILIYDGLLVTEP
jgi:hypothetical protein